MNQLSKYTEYSEYDFVCAQAELGKRHLYDFVRICWDTIESDKYIDGWHIQALCEYLEALWYGEIRNLVVCLPPRHSKSLISSVMFPAWGWIRNPGKRFITSSYAQVLALRDAVKTRSLVESLFFRKRWDYVKLVQDNNQKQLYYTTKGGHRFSTSVCGAVTGEGADIFSCDDPHNVLEAESVQVRSETIRWWREVVTSRLNDPKRSAKLIVAQRTNEYDLPGEMINEGYEKLVLSCEYESNHKHLFMRDPRKREGQLLWDERYSDKEIMAWKRELGSYAYAAQYQQNPVPREGGLFEFEWWQYIDLKDIPILTKVVRGWDFAGSETKHADYTASCKMGISKDGCIFILNVSRQRIKSGRIKKHIQSIINLDGKMDVVQSVPQDPGQAGKYQRSDLISTVFKGFPVKFSLESGSKETRAQALATEAEAGNVYIVRGDWNQEFIGELCSFPNGKFDDQVDSASRAYHQLMGNRKRMAMAAPQTFKNPSDTVETYGIDRPGVDIQALTTMQKKETPKQEKRKIKWASPIRY